jgi:hypothetical protein
VFKHSTLAPERVLLKRRGAPTLNFVDWEGREYFANERRWPDGEPVSSRDVLPDSDLLKAVHAYSSRFYEVMGRLDPACSFVGPRLVDERSMDETALLAVGILLEEAAREVVKKSGDLVFTEGLLDEDGREVYIGPEDAEHLDRRSDSKPKRRKTRPQDEESEASSTAAVPTG